ncbi:MAG: hypothetical protein R3C49_04185 [Planctomycetaceae bacterium]
MRLTAALCLLSLTVSAQAADIKSGLDVGASPGAYYVQDVTGPSAGTKLCYRCQYGNQPVVNIFTRKMDANVTKLVKEIDSVVAKNSADHKMKAFVVVLTDDPDAQADGLKKCAEENQIKHTPLTVFDNNVGPKSYRLSEDADVTVLMWVESDVKVNHAYKLTELNSDAIQKIVGDTAKILN